MSEPKTVTGYDVRVAKQIVNEVLQKYDGRYEPEKFHNPINQGTPLIVHNEKKIK